MKKIICIMLAVIIVCGFVGCTEAERVRQNISKEADNFNVQRIIIFGLLLRQDVEPEVRDGPGCSGYPRFV